MNALIINHEPAIRLGFFVGIFLAVALGELAAPRRHLTTSKAARWFANIGIVVINTAAVRFLFPVAAVGMAVIAAQKNVGAYSTMSRFRTGSLLSCQL